MVCLDEPGEVGYPCSGELSPVIEEDSSIPPTSEEEEEEIPFTMTLRSKQKTRAAEVEKSMERKKKTLSLDLDRRYGREQEPVVPFRRTERQTDGQTDIHRAKARKENFNAGGFLDGKGKSSGLKGRKVRIHLFLLCCFVMEPKRFLILIAWEKLL